MQHLIFHGRRFCAVRVDLYGLSGYNMKMKFNFIFDVVSEVLV